MDRAETRTKLIANGFNPKLLPENGNWSLDSEYFNEAELAGMDFAGTDLRFAEFVEANLEGAVFNKATLAEANLRGARLSHAVFAEADLTLADLTEADLRCTNLYGADLTGACLRGVRWLRASQLAEAKHIEDAYYDAAGAAILAAALTLRLLQKDK